MGNHVETYQDIEKGSGIDSDKKLKESYGLDQSIPCENKAECVNIKQSFTESDLCMKAGQHWKLS